MWGKYVITELFQEKTDGYGHCLSGPIYPTLKMPKVAYSILNLIHMGQLIHLHSYLGIAFLHQNREMLNPVFSAPSETLMLLVDGQCCYIAKEIIPEYFPNF